MGDREIVLGIEPFFNQGINVIDVELAFLQNQINEFIANKTPARLPREQCLF
jgi:hypothetical protein